MTKKNYITVLNVLSAFCVVLLHTNSCFWTCSSSSHWTSANLIECLCYFAIPVFFMISGATLINYRDRYDTKTFFKKRFLKTLFPFIFWCIFGFFYCLKLGRFSVEGNIFLSLLNNIMLCQQPSIYWFFPCLFAAYLCIPIISLIPKETRKSALKYIIFFTILLNAFLPLIFKLLPLIFKSMSPTLAYNGNYIMPIGYGNILFLFIGYYIDNYEIKLKHRIIIYILAVLGFCMHFFGTALLTTDGSVSTLFKGYIGIPSILYSSGIFLLFKNINFEKLKFVTKTADFFKGETFGVYLLHIYIIYLIINLDKLNIHSLTYRTVGAMVIFTLTALAVKVLRKIPGIKFIIP